MSPVMQTEVQPSSKLVRAIRCFYYGAMIVGLPLWLLVTCLMVAWVRFIIWPIPEIGPVEFQSPSATQVAVLRTAGIAFFVAYPAAFLWACRVTRHPWTVFTVMLVPVLVFCYAIASFSITDSNAEERAWLSYLGSLAFVLAAGCITSCFPARVCTTRRASA